MEEEMNEKMSGSLEYIRGWFCWEGNWRGRRKVGGCNLFW